jgi:hypothetical protein
MEDCRCGQLPAPCCCYAAPRQLAVRLSQARPVTAGAMRLMLTLLQNTQLTSSWLCVFVNTSGLVPLAQRVKPAPQIRVTAGLCPKSALWDRSHPLVQSARQSVCASLATVGVQAQGTLARSALQEPGHLVAALRPAFPAALATAGAHVRGGPHFLDAVFDLLATHARCSRCCPRRQTH